MTFIELSTSKVASPSSGSRLLRLVLLASCLGGWVGCSTLTPNGASVVIRQSVSVVRVVSGDSVVITNPTEANRGDLLDYDWAAVNEGSSTASLRSFFIEFHLASGEVVSGGSDLSVELGPGEEFSVPNSGRIRIDENIPTGPLEIIVGFDVEGEIVSDDYTLMVVGGSGS